MHSLQLYLNLESSLEATGKEATKGADNRGKARESYAVDLEWVETHRGLWRKDGNVRDNLISFPLYCDNQFTLCA